MKNVFLAILAVMLISGCAHSLKSRAESWVGTPQKDVISKLGPPDSNFKDSSGTEYYTYVSTGAAVTNHNEYLNRSYTYQPVCKSVFAFNDKAAVQNVSYIGDCK